MPPTSSTNVCYLKETKKGEKYLYRIKNRKFGMVLVLN